MSRKQEVLDQIKELATDIERGDFYYGPLETKCRLIRILADTIRDEEEGTT
jgi:hypothetical protein